MKALAINGSARQHGNTEILLNTCLDTLRKEGIEGGVISLAEHTLLPCSACRQCYTMQNRQCVLKDDFDEIFSTMVEADIIIVGSPVYFGSATANLTALLDRAGCVARANGNLFSRKLGGPVVVARRAGQNFTYAQLLYWYMISDMIVPGSTYWNVGFGGAPGEVEGDEEALNTVTRFAQNLSWLAHKTQG